MIAVVTVITGAAGAFIATQSGPTLFALLACSMLLGGTSVALLLGAHSRLLGARFSIPVVMLFVSLSIVRWEPAPFEILMVAAIPLYIFLNSSNPNWLPINRLLLGICLATVIFQSLSIPLTSEPLVSLRFWMISNLMIVITLVGAFLGRSLASLASVTLGYTIGAIATSLFSLLAYYGVVPLQDIVVYQHTRLQGFFKDPNVFAPYLILPAVILFESLLNRESLFPLGSRLMRGGMFIFLSYCIFLAYSRAAWVAFAVSIVSLLVIMLLRNPRAIPRIVLVVIVGAVVLFLARDFLPESQLEIFQQRTSLQTYDQRRFDAQANAWEESSDNLLLGHGPYSTVLDFRHSTHNVYLMTLYEHGLPGLILLLALIGGACIYAFKFSIKAPDVPTSRWSAIVLSLLLGQLVASLVVDSTHWRHLWLIYGMAWALPMMAQRLQSEQQGKTIP